MLPLSKAHVYALARALVSSADHWRALQPGTDIQSFHATALRKQALYPVHQLAIAAAAAADEHQPGGASRLEPGNRMHAQLMPKTEAEAGEVLVPNRGFMNSSNVALSLAPAQDQGTLTAKAATLKFERAEASDARSRNTTWTRTTARSRRRTVLQATSGNERKSLLARRSARRYSSHRLQVGSYGQLPQDDRTIFPQ